MPAVESAGPPGSPFIGTKRMGLVAAQNRLRGRTIDGSPNRVYPGPCPQQPDGRITRRHVRESVPRRCAVMPLEREIALPSRISLLSRPRQPANRHAAAVLPNSSVHLLPSISTHEEILPPRKANKKNTPRERTGTILGKKHPKGSPQPQPPVESLG